MGIAAHRSLIDKVVPERKLGFQRVAYSPAPGDRGRFHWAVCDDQRLARINVRIPDQGDHRFHGKATTDSTRRRPAFPCEGER